MKFFLALFFLTLALPTSAQNTLTVGSKRFTESYILGEIIKQKAEKAGEANAVHRQGLGNTAIVFAALKTGAIDVYPEYTGTISQELLKQKKTGTLEEIDAQLAAQNLGVAIPLGFNDTYALAMRDEQAQKLGIKTIGDLTKHSELRYGLSQEFIGRADGWNGVKAAYNLTAVPRGIDHGLAYAAIGDGQIDVTDIYSTDAKIAKYKLRVLEDDKKFFPAYDAVLLYRRDLPKRLPKTWAALETLKDSITADAMIRMNADAELNHQTFAAIASNFLTSGGNVKTAGKPIGFLGLLFGPDFWPETWRHLELVFVSLIAGIVGGVPLGILAARRASLAGPILTSVGVVQTIPSLALLAFLIPILHQIGLWPALVALFLYSLLPIVRNTYTGLTDIAPPLRESALALGLPPNARLRLVELPLAARAIFAGIKTSAVINVGTATIAAFIGAGGYGDRIATGLSLNDNATLLSGAIPAAALALLVQGLFDLLDRRLIPAGLRQRAG